jgi:hypothetical protein
LLTLTLVPVSVALGDDDDGPIARTDEPTEVTATTARVNGFVAARGEDATATFEYGTTLAYGSISGVFRVQKRATDDVSQVLRGLTPGTTYHVRLLAESRKGAAVGADQTFTTPAGTAPAPSAPGSGDDAGTPGATTPGATPQPVLGDSVVVAPAKGTVRVKAAGSSGYVGLAAGDAIPVGSILDTRRGTVTLTTSLPGGRTQTAELRGAVFQIRQAPGAKGMTDIVLRGAPLTGCARKAQAARRKKHTVRRLWASDDGGRFRTHGHNSVATVRGTKWVTTETCAGTRTTVTSGAVSVRDLRRKRSVLVRAGHSYLARTKR